MPGDDRQLTLLQKRATNMASENAPQKACHSILDSHFPVLVPKLNALLLPESEFQQHLRSLLEKDRKPAERQLPQTAELADSKERTAQDEPKSAFTEGLRQHEAHLKTPDDLARENKTLTANADVTNISSKNPLVDLFYDLTENTKGSVLGDLLAKSWEEDPLVTLKIIFNARSIHLGKGNRMTLYRSVGWLAEHHPISLLSSLKWLVRPIIEKKTAKPGDKGDNPEAARGEGGIQPEDDDFDMIEDEDDPKTVASSDTAKVHDIRFGVSHGYWKDLLNILALAANSQLRIDGDPASILNQQVDNTRAAKRKREYNQQQAKSARKQKTAERHERVLKKLDDDPFYLSLHLTVARLFADQLKGDLKLLQSGKPADLRKLSLAAKWTPSFGEFHDKHTFVLSSIAEILYPKPEEICPDADNRELYLRHAREAFRKNYSSPLRKELKVVEREIAANRFGDIQYERVPSLAMEQYTELFLKKDFDHFKGYIDKVAKGGATISGATLLPSTLVSKARTLGNTPTDFSKAQNLVGVKVSAKASIMEKLIDGQWKALVQRIRDSGALASSIAVCDVSGSMGGPRFKDGSCPMDSAIGLSLLLAEITAPPFGGAMITFSESPTFISVGGEQDTRDFVEKVKYTAQADWGGNTDFCAVFEHLILPMAVKHKLKADDMVKQIFVFSDMQFDQANYGTERWTSSFERIKQAYQAHGYEMPKLIFWNLSGDSTSKPTTMEDVNTALVSGYSQGMLKVFLDGGGFEDPEEDEVVEKAVEGEDGMTELVVEQKKMDPLTIVKKAVSHKAYKMLEVVD